MDDRKTSNYQTHKDHLKSDVKPIVACYLKYPGYGIHIQMMNPNLFSWEQPTI